MNKSRKVIVNGAEYRLVQSDRYGWGLQSREDVIKKTADDWVDVCECNERDFATVLAELLIVHLT